MLIGASETAGEPWVSSVLSFMESPSAGRECDDPERLLIVGGAGQVTGRGHVATAARGSHGQGQNE